MWWFLFACGGIEGDDPGECTDGADNDGNGLFDCRDPGCQGGEDCLDVEPVDSDEPDPGDSGQDSDPPVMLWLDGDGDGWGGAGEDPDGVELDGDCDDDDPSIHPEAEELCDGVDQDCDDQIDDGLAVTAGWADADEDGFGAGAYLSGCDVTEVVDNVDDCDDTDAAVHPDAIELCDGLDNDCDPSTTASGVAFTDSSGVVTEATLDGSELRLGTGTLAFCESGTWPAYIVATGDLSIVNESGDPADVVLDGEDDRIVLQVSGHDVVVSGVTIEGGRHDAGDGGGIWCGTTGTLKLTDVVFRANSARRGAGLTGDTCDVTGERVSFTENTGDWAPAVLMQNADLDLTDSSATFNTASDDVGAMILTNSAGTWDEVLLADNHAGGAIGALSCNQCELVWSGSTTTESGALRNSTDDAGAAIYMPTNSWIEGVVLDLGEGANDNEAHDIYGIPGGYFDEGDDVTFWCEDGCE
ncbi:MAG: hypothetical protein GY913_30310 [Proteobacteria bacterium]|nr:hypothetical protein [Pseudomonadota bacterium]MCP4921212.1 hypothetical protein [Pseudomonadota bacterium]